MQVLRIVLLQILGLKFVATTVTFNHGTCVGNLDEDSGYFKLHFVMVNVLNLDICLVEYFRIFI